MSGRSRDRSKHGRDVLTIPADVFEAMLAHCEMEAPLEACGLLGGVFPCADLFYPLVNIDQSETRYNADPRGLIRADQDLRNREARILAIYHSHPKSRPVPSKADLALNYHDETPRIIVSLLNDPPEVRAWRLSPDAYEELPWRVEG